MKAVKFIILEILFLIVMLICATVTMKILDILFKISYENIWMIGFKVGFLAWIVLLVITLIVKVKSKK